MFPLISIDFYLINVQLFRSRAQWRIQDMAFGVWTLSMGGGQKVIESVDRGENVIFNMFWSYIYIW